MSFLLDSFRQDREEKSNRYRKTVVDVYCEGNTKEAINYTFSIIDRIINKASSLLAYNAIIVATYAILLTNEQGFFLLFGITVAIISCLVMFPIIQVDFTYNDKIENQDDIFETMLEKVRARAVQIDRALTLSFISTAYLFILMAYLSF